MAKKKASIDSKRIRNAAHKVVYDAFGKFGAYGMKVARNSIKNAPKTNKPLDETQIAVKGQFGRVASRPGRPPFSHKGNLKKSILFAVDREEKNVVNRQARRLTVFPGSSRRSKPSGLPHLPRWGPVSRPLSHRLG